MRVDLSYLSASCNRTPKACHWGNNGLICYASCNSIIIYNPKDTELTKNTRSLIGHSNRVNSVRWLQIGCKEEENEIVSASNDGTVIIWTITADGVKNQVLKGHEDGVNIADGIYLTPDKESLLIVTASIDSTCRVWLRNNIKDDFRNIQVINFERGLCLAVSLAFLPNSNTVLFACARDNSKIQLYTLVENSVEKQFKISETLKGHENWVRGLDFIQDGDNLYLASGAQDSFIRIWCISPIADTNQQKSIIELLGEHKMRAMEANFSVNIGTEIKYFTVHLESVLCGHEGWVYDVHWCPRTFHLDGSPKQLKLLSSSVDKTMVIWTLDESSGLWMETVRVGEVGGNTLGFYGSRFSPDGSSIIGHSYLGSFHIWNYISEKDTWEPGVTVGGHFNEVVDIGWEPEGEFLLSVSTDQTTRIHAPWVRDHHEISWHELARPQVHGYDMSCLAVISRYKFVSGAEEKIVRAFTAPSNFISNFRKICNVVNDKDGDEILSGAAHEPKGASVPSLGLSNKAVFNSSNDDDAKPKGKDAYAEDSYFHELQLQAPPTEENLLQNTLWPEIQKLYGHGYEIFAIAATKDTTLIASASKATNSEYAAILLWCTNTWSIKQKLISHNLTVTQLMFSPDNEKLLSVSRDRRWTIFEKNSENEFVLTATTDKKNGIHSRIIWCCAWSHDSKYFVTGSRDGRAVLWCKNDEKIPNDSLGSYECVGIPLELKGESITAIAFAPILVQNNYLLCIGLESGVLIVYKWNLEQNWQQCSRLDQSLAHHLTVKRIFFRPKRGQAGKPKCDEDVLQIASCSSDHTVKIYNLYLD